VSPKPVANEVKIMVDQLALSNAAPSEDEIRKWVRKSKVLDSVVKLPGDASTRRYFRVSSEKKSYIVMQMESFADQGMNLNFLAMQRHLAASGVDVPEVLDVDPKRGFILLEDLTDTTFLRRLQEVSDAETERLLYQRVIDALVHMQIHASPGKKGVARGPRSLDKADGDLEAFRLRFDHEKLMWEMTNTIEHFYEIYLKREITARDRKVMMSGFSEICTLLAAQPTVLAHRDFHSRNIMVTPTTDKKRACIPGERLVMIDFQDARLGPAQYDLVSLLRDCYYQLEEEQIRRLIDYYIARWEALSGEPLDRQNFFYVFDLMAVQRNFKAIGSFASFLNRRGNATYLKYIGNTFENIRRTLLKYPKYSDLREVLFHYYYF
jgi:N-acetylmuramate 1-kinase